MLVTSVWMAGFLCTPVRAASATGAGIDDKSGFFSEKAKAEADALISQTAAKLRKDLRIAMEAARSNGAQLPATALIDQFYAGVQKQGGGKLDTSSLIKLLVQQ